MSTLRVNAIQNTNGIEHYLAKAWVNFNGTFGTSPFTLANGGIRGAGNVSSITKDETGVFQINFTTAMQDANYAAVAVASGTGGAAFRIVTVSQYGTTACILRSADVPSAAGIYPVPQDAETLCVAVFR
jgi:hypothetical protein